MTSVQAAIQEKNNHYDFGMNGLVFVTTQKKWIGSFLQLKVL